MLGAGHVEVDDGVAGELGVLVEADGKVDRVGQVVRVVRRRRGRGRRRLAARPFVRVEVVGDELLARERVALLRPLDNVRHGAKAEKRETKAGYVALEAIVDALEEAVKVCARSSESRRRPSNNSQRCSSSATCGR